MTAGQEDSPSCSASRSRSTRAAWVPLQDTPQMRFTYSAHVTAPADAMVLMSADNDPERGTRWRLQLQDAAEDSVLPAGDRRRRPGVQADRRAQRRVGGAGDGGQGGAKEFEDTEKMIDTAEKLYGPYRWGRYDLLVLPPSFPFGGMENPRLTFATPTVIVGDKSLVSLIAHELAHSWSGNLVTNRHLTRTLWLNEGITSYVQNRIVESLYGTRHGGDGRGDRPQRVEGGVQGTRSQAAAPLAEARRPGRSRTIPPAPPCTPRAPGSCSSWSSATAAPCSIRG
jgi:leukotriene-A4 hydrolase